MKTVSMKPVVQKPRKDGFWPVYIRFNYNGRCQFWKTTKVVFAMNHGSAHRVTQRYVKKDFSPAWELNDRVVDFIFFSDIRITFRFFERKVTPFPRNVEQKNG